MVWTDPPSGTWGTPNMNDPQQGVLDDCIFIAGLSAYAWHDSTIAPKIEDAEYYVFYFRNSGVLKKVRVSKKLCYEGGSLPFASSRDFGELWPAYYEKAYAAYLAAGRNATSVDTFVMRNVAFGRNGKQAMEDLTGFTYTDPLISSIDDCYTFINGKCTGGKTRRPMIAWTKTSSVAAGITLNHAYTVLGVASTNYIILRNPKRGAAQPTGNHILTGSVVLGGITINLSNGIFGLHKNSFKDSFYKLAWTT